jgi:hypothetical protein
MKIKIQDLSNEVWMMKYKDQDADEAPWQRWSSTDRPSDLMIQALREQGMHRLERVCQCSVAYADLIKF